MSEEMKIKIIADSESFEKSIPKAIEINSKSSEDQIIRSEAKKEALQRKTETKGEGEEERRLKSNRATMQTVGLAMFSQMLTPMKTAQEKAANMASAGGGALAGIVAEGLTRNVQAGFIAKAATEAAIDATTHAMRTVAGQTGQTVGGYAEKMARAGYKVSDETLEEMADRNTAVNIQGYRGRARGIRASEKSLSKFGQEIGALTIDTQLDSITGLFSESINTVSNTLLGFEKKLEEATDSLEKAQKKIEEGN